MRKIVVDESGIRRFEANRIVRLLLSGHQTYTLCDIGQMYDIGLVSKDEAQEFYQLIGYSVDGYCEMFEVDDDPVPAYQDTVLRHCKRCGGDMFCLKCDKELLDDRGVDVGDL